MVSLLCSPVMNLDAPWPEVARATQCVTEHQAPVRGRVWYKGDQGEGDSTERVTCRTDQDPATSRGDKWGGKGARDLGR